MTILKVNNLSKTFSSKENEVQALKSVNLEINHGDFIAIIGTSGSGKSTLLNILGLLDTQTSGEYFIEGINTKTLKDKELATLRNKTFGFIVQHFALIKDFSVYDNIEIPLEYGKVKKKLRKEKIELVLNKIGLKDKINTKSGNLSGGQSQRVAIARALVNEPAVILADEPTGALDSNTTEEIMSIFENLNKDGHTIVIITHDMDIASRCQRIISIEDGVLKENSKQVLL
ncbi:ABC transporter ATP-binding protein [Clostridium mediterraneense]|uniref:ABC transporter ATP-binding protein n=1 Tax=Clostridium mediterraneense TaxID=1805472 RepID=UPI0008306251|nr:ABC transporter ATP-binding protein [Clostridium mediterraneense]